MDRNLLNIYSLKYNPFSLQLPEEALITTPAIEHFIWRVENLAREGGFAAIWGNVGNGKSSALRLLAARIAIRGEILVGELSRPQAYVADFYREMGDIFGVELRPNNRWAGTKVLRQRWLNHVEATRMRPLLLVDEAQRMHPMLFEELRLLQSERFDSRHLLTVVFSGDQRLLEKLQGPDLLPIKNRIRAQLFIMPAKVNELFDRLKKSIAAAGNPGLMTETLIQTLAEHSAGNWRTMMNSANELLLAAAAKQQPLLDEKLYFEVFATPLLPFTKQNKKKKAK